MNNRSSFIIRQFGPNIIISVAYLVMLFGLFYFYGAKFRMDHFKLWSIMLSTLIVVYFSTAIYHRIKTRASNSESIMHFVFKSLLTFARDWLPLIILVTIYENLRDYTTVVRTNVIDATLHKIDLLVFGVAPTVWIQKITIPILTDYFVFAYSLWFVLVLAIAWLLYILHKRREFHEVATSITICMCVGFVLYILFPAGPPRFYLADLYTNPFIKGYFSNYNTLHTALDGLNPLIHRSSFPSLHCAMSTIAMIYAVKFKDILPWGRFLRFVCIILSISIWISTVYLRHHWVVDIFAGWCVAIFSVYGSAWIHKKWPGPK